MKPSDHECVYEFMADSGQDPVGLFGHCNPFTAEIPFGHVGRAFIMKDAAGNVIPKTVREAMKLPEAKSWLDCWNKELEALLKFQIGDLVPAPKHRKVLKFKIKYNADGSILKYKAHFVACGYSQVYGLDYLETFAPVAQLPAIRLMLSICVNLGLEMFHIDFENAFLQSRRC